MVDTCSFKFSHLEQCFKNALESEYKIITCREYVEYKKNNHTYKVLVNRVDIDANCKKAKILAQIFNAMNIKASFFVRLHANEYNPFSFEDYRCIRYIRDTGHEIGLHSEVIDVASIWKEEAEKCLIRDIELLNSMFDIQIKGIASHGGLTGFNNLDFWKHRKASDFGLLYETYDKEPTFGLFYDSLYISDSNWTHWKCYEKGVLRENDNLCLCKHFQDGTRIINSLIHSETYYYEHFYE